MAFCTNINIVFSFMCSVLLERLTKTWQSLWSLIVKVILVIIFCCPCMTEQICSKLYSESLHIKQLQTEIGCIKKKKKTFVCLIVCCGCKNYCTIKPEPIKKASPNTACLSHLCSSLDNRLPITDRKPELRHRGSTQGSNELTPCLLFAVLNQSTATNQYIPRMHVC